MENNSKIFLKLATSVLIGIAFSSLTARAELGGSIELDGGYQSNIFRRPSALDTGTGIFDPSEGDGMMGGNAQLQFLQPFNEAHRIKLGSKMGGNFFPAHSSSSESELEGSAEYRFRPGPSFNLRLLGSGAVKRQLTVDETVDEAAALYQYMESVGGAKAVYSPSKIFSCEGSYAFTQLDYKEPLLGQSLDNQQNEITVGLAWRTGPGLQNSLRLNGAYLLKAYRALLSYDANGTQAPNYPARTYHYFTVELEFKSKRDAWLWKFSERPRFRKDAYAGFYDYIENRLSAGIDINAMDKWSFSPDVAWRFRFYPTHEALRPGPNPNLMMNYIDAGLKIKRSLGKNFSLSASYDLALRLTNTGYDYLRSYRDYADHTVLLGAELEW